MILPNFLLQINCDNQTAVSYLNHQGGKVTRLHLLTRKIWNLFEDKQAFLEVVYVPSELNQADQFTRGWHGKHKRRFLDLEVQLNPENFHFVVLSGPFIPTVDLFASRANAL